MFGLRSARSRAIVAGVVLLVLLASVAALAVWRAYSDQRRHDAVEHAFVQATSMERAHAYFRHAQAALSALVFSGDPTLVDDYQQAAAAVERHLSEARAEALAEGEGDEVLALDDLSERIGQFNEKVDLGLPVLLEADPETAAQLANTARSEMASGAEAIVADLKELIQEEQQELAANRGAAHRATATTLWLLIALSAVAFLVAAGTVAVLVVSVVRPLAALRANARAIASGDLKARAKASGPQEVASLAHDFNDMADALLDTQEYIATVNLTGDIIAKVDRHGRWTFLNDAACRFYGRPREELLGADSRGQLHPEDVAPSVQAIRKAAATREPIRGFVNRQVTPMGTRVVEWNASPFFDQEGRYAGIQMTGRDITERKQAEELVRQAEQRYRALFEEAPAMYVIVRNQEGVPIVADCNELFLSTLGYSSAEVLERPLADFYTPKSRAELLEGGGFQRGLKGQLVAEERQLLRRDGRIVQTLLRAQPETDPEGHVFGTRAMYIDITERNRAEEALRESEEKYRRLVQDSVDGIAIVQGLEVKFVNRALLKMYGGESEEEMVGHTFTDFVSPEYRELMAERARAREKGEHVPDRYEFKALRNDGSAFDAEIAIGRITYHGGVALQGIIRNVSERKRVEEALRESEGRYRLLAENTSDIIWTMDLSLKYTYVSPAVTRMRGYSVEEVMAQTVNESMTAASREVAMKTLAEELAIEKMEQKDLFRSRTLELEMNRKDGSTIWCEMKMTFLRDRDGQPVGILGVTRDISERKKAEREREGLHAELELRAITDSLTGLYDHAHFYRRLAEEIERSKRYNHRFAVVMMDVDDFKRFNDSRGHQVGDKALRLVGYCIRSGLRRSDLAFRYGGDEFAAILPHADSAKARAVVDRINGRITESLRQMNGEAGDRLTLSAGVACFPDDGAIGDDLVRIADGALYSAKWVARARDIMGQREDIESLVSALVSRRAGVEAPPGGAIFRPEALHEQHARIVSSVASSIAVALKDAGVAQALEDPDLQILAVVGAAAEIKDRYIRGHPERTSEGAVALAEEMGVSPERVRDIRIAGLLHDIGKVTVGEAILNKRGKLTRREFASIKEHPIVGATLVSQVGGFGRLVPIIRHHHERFDGKGYPDGLAGEDISLEARILSVVDVFDALTHERSYRKALSREKAIAQLERGAGTQFDAMVVEAFLALVSRRGEDPAIPAQAASEDRQPAATRAPGRGKG